MAQTGPPKHITQPPIQSKKRKNAPTNQNAPKYSPNKKQKTDHRARQRDARTLSTQTTSKAFANGALDVDKFVKAREFEIHALEQSMQRSKKALNRRAFQQVPKELRRRTASHDVRRVPKRLRERGKKEMVEDHTPTVTAKKRKPTRHMRLRLETAKRLRALGAQKKAAKAKEKVEEVTVSDPSVAKKDTSAKSPAARAAETSSSTVTTRTPRVKKKTALAKPPVPKAKFRKRQVHKSWLPTHLFHAKRAHIIPPSAPLWRFAIPLTPTQKSYRPTHRANHERGAVAWDVSYTSTIGLEGQQRSLEGILQALGVDVHGLNSGVWGKKVKNGTRVLETFTFEREAPHHLIAPMTVLWCVPTPADDTGQVEDEKRKRNLFLRTHPSAFYQIWEEVVRLAKVAKPAVSVEDLRFEIGSIDITGPGSTEALLGALWPIFPEAGQSGIKQDSVEKIWTNLAGLTNPATLPAGALLAFDIQDPRLHHPARTIKLPKSQDEQNSLLHLLSAWRVDKSQPPPHLFDRTRRLKSSKLPSQKSINRRKSLADPGSYPPPVPTDPHIPVVLYTTSSTKHHAKWSVLAPWKTIQTIWYAIMYYPLSTGQQPRFGGLREQQQLAFEAGRPWFPADFPGTKAGWEWEVRERRRRWEEWRRRPKGKRVAWEKVDLGDGRKGEVGEGWACDWALLLAGECTEVAPLGQAAKDAPDDAASAKGGEKTGAAPALPPSKPDVLANIPFTEGLNLLRPASASSTPATKLDGKLITVRLTLLSRGVPQTCARIYRLPSSSTNPESREAWLALRPTSTASKHKQNHRGPKHALPRLPKNAPPHLVQQRLAQSLLETPRAGEDRYPTCPGQEDLVGFVTSGNFNLAEGQGTGVGCLLVSKVLEDVGLSAEEGKLCVVRNAGADVGRLARWEMA